MPGITVSPTALSMSVVAELEALLGDDPYAAVLAEHVREISANGVDRHRGLVARDGDRLAGYAHLQQSVDGQLWSLDVMVPADAPGAAATTRELLTSARAAVAAQRAEWWARGPHVQVARSVAEAVGIGERRVIERMEMDLGGFEPSSPAETRPYTEDDGDAVVTINNAAFAGHADRSSWDLATLQHTLAGLGNRYDDLLLSPVSSPDGFCWTKRHPDGTGEIYVLAAHPRAQGTGLGMGLLQAGLARIEKVFGARTAMLYVDAANGHAIALYEKAGFTNVGRPLVAFDLSH